MFRKILLTVMTVLVGILPASTAIRHINVRDGLSSRQVYEIEEDSDGYMWIFNNSGLDRFDGSGIKHYILDERESQNDHILSGSTMETDSEGSLWVAVKSGGIYHYLRQSDSFEKVFDLSPYGCLLYNFMILPGNTLVVCTNNGLYSCSSEKGISRMALDGKFVSAVTSDGHDGYFAGTDHGVYHVEPRGNSFRSSLMENTRKFYVRSMLFAGKRLYVGTFTQGTVVINPDDNSISRLPFHIPTLPVNAITAFDQEQLLLSIDGAGVYRIRTADGSLVKHYRDGDGSDSDLSGNTVTDVHVDRYGGIWIATSHNGVNYLPPFNNSVKLLKASSSDSQSLVSDYVNIVYEDSDGDIWFGTDKGVSRYNPSQNLWWRYLQRSDYVASVVLSIGESPDGHILVGTYGDGVSIIDKNSGSVSRMPSRQHGTNSGTGTDYVFVSRSDGFGNTWIGGINGALTRIEQDNKTFNYYDADCIATTAVDRGGKILLAGNKGLGEFNYQSDQLNWTNSFDSIQLRYPIRALAIDTLANELWIGTQGEGLIRYLRNTKKARHYTTADGLSSNSIYGLTFDSSGKLWVSTETDLYRIDPANGKLRRLTYYLGTNRGVFNAGGLSTLRSGEIMLGSAEGCYVFNPNSEFKTDSTHKHILFTDLLMHDRSVVPGAEGSPLARSINLSEKLSLRHWQNAFDIKFTIIDYANPQRIGFEYFLENYDHQPLYCGSNGSARYSDLDPGHYTLIVKGIDLYSGSIIDERRLEIEVLPPFWLSLPAKCIYMLILLLSAWMAWNILQRIRREHRIEAQLQSYAAIAHDIRTPMSMIKGPLLNVEHENLSEKGRASLQQARAGIDKTMAMLADLLNLRRDTRSSQRLQIRNIDILKFLQVKTEEYSSLALFKGIRLNYNVPEGMPLLPTDHDRFDHIIDNLLSNALKYTNHGSVTINVALLGKKHWQLSVCDTGIGISKRDARLIFRSRHRSAEAMDCDSSGIGMGLLITRRLVHDLHGNISFESQPDRGSIFKVTLPLKYPSRFMVAENHTDPDHAATYDIEIKNYPDNEPDETRNTIFAVEDDHDMLTYLRDNLSDDYNIICCDNSSNALDEIKRLNPDLVISDVMMPHLRGDELCTMLKTNVDTSHIPVILLTGLGSRSDIVAGLEARADDYVVKPFDIVVLRARIRNIIKTRRELGRRMLAEDCSPSHEEFSNELDRRFMTRTMEIINEHLSDSEFSVNELCSELGMSRTSVYNKIKAISGQSPNEFVRIMRLNKAKELLGTRTYNISEVAYMTGFSDPKYFSTCFKKQFGTSPSKI